MYLSPFPLFVFHNSLYVKDSNLLFLDRYYAKFLFNKMSFRWVC